MIEIYQCVSENYLCDDYYVECVTKNIGTSAYIPNVTGHFHNPVTVLD